MRRLFDDPAHVVYGRESADEAHLRFQSALHAALGLPSYVVLSWSHGKLIEVVENL